jgi:hypothetical protein
MGPVNISFGDVVIHAPAGSDSKEISGIVLDELGRKLVPVLRKNFARSL